jgi:hypothetical protein
MLIQGPGGLLLVGPGGLLADGQDCCCDHEPTVTTCCPSAPEVLTGTFVTDCGCFNYDVTLTEIGPDARHWTAEPYIDPCSGETTNVGIWCNDVEDENGPGGPGWHMEKLTSAQCRIRREAVGDPTGTCEPFHLEFVGIVDDGVPCLSCTPGTPFRFIVTE